MKRHFLNLNDAVQILQQGRPLIYPTETFFAIGAGVFFEDGQRRIVHIKKRPPQKPFPLLCADMAQVETVVDHDFFQSHLGDSLRELAELFWPGPLSVVLPARQGLPHEIVSSKNMISIRVTPHSGAAALAKALGMPISASSANSSGQPAVSQYQLLDQNLIEETGALYIDGPVPAGGLPSTVIVLLDKKNVTILRDGALPRQALRDAGFIFQSNEII